MTASADFPWESPHYGASGAAQLLEVIGSMDSDYSLAFEKIKDNGSGTPAAAK